MTCHPDSTPDSWQTWDSAVAVAEPVYLLGPDGRYYPAGYLDQAADR
jgi:hypothetical protein